MTAVHHVQQVLQRWDPIGVMPDAFEPAADEYDSYAPHIVSLLARGVSVAELSDHLQHIRTVTMGLPADVTRDTRCAEELIGWWKQRTVLSGPVERNPLHREPDLLQRLIHGLFGAFLGGLIGLLPGYFFDDHVVWIVGSSAAICFLVAFVFGDTAIEWILRAARWV